METQNEWVGRDINYRTPTYSAHARVEHVLAAVCWRRLNCGKKSVRISRSALSTSQEQELCMLLTDIFLILDCRKEETVTVDRRRRSLTRPQYRSHSLLLSQSFGGSRDK